MALKGHRRGCKCVGCSPATRARGMKKLTNRRRRPVRRAKLHRKIAGQARTRRVGRAPRRNPDENFIGSAPSLKVHGHGTLSYPRGVLRATSDPHVVRLDLGGAAPPPQGARVTWIYYDDPVKAVEAYGEIDRFEHVAEDHPFIVGPAQGGSVLLTSKSIAWRRE